MNVAAIQAAYARALGANGPAETVHLVRAGVGSFPAQAWITDFIPEDLAGAVEEGRRSAIVLAASVVASGFPLPFLVKQDRLAWGTKSNAIVKVDDASRRVQGVLIAYELDLDGA